MASDEELMARVVKGDTQALGVLFERYQQPLFGFLYRLLNDRTAAEDLLQDTFFRIYDRRRTYQLGMKFSTWMFTIAKNLTADYFKHSARREMPVSQMATDDDEKEVEHFIDPSDVVEDWQKAELVHAVRRAVHSLPEDQRTVIILREYQGLSYRDIAAVVGCSEETVRVRAHRARQALKRRLAPFVETATAHE
ncbi:MAG: RNA polymerase sigma factor [Abditibacteriales bacterium]|nr:RNA polymerase sigma factor [Abditibacteriales bacterium]MDW8368097.1 RNA polymerase sigma factor [Abditibacteriales bacterium]